MQEILFTIKTSENTFLYAAFSILGFLFVFAGIYFGIMRIRISKKISIVLISFLLLSLPVYFLVRKYQWIEIEKISKNKSIYFYTKSLQYFLRPSTAHADYSASEHTEYTNLFSQNDVPNYEFPLLHRFNNEDVLSPFFNQFSEAPNIVILIVEGLNDDFLHAYRGLTFMPFLSALQEKSLYWERCFSLGERSFLVVPSLLGGLPYGEKGFTFLDTIPNHETLINVLNENGYETSFFYGQGAWFHRKDIFFKHNGIDHIFDNTSFSDAYSKIIVGVDNYFWGYNDKSLFTNSLEKIDQFSTKKRLDIYFTGTMHSPFSISPEEAIYKQKFEVLIAQTQSKEDRQFFKQYQKYFESILFFDDALKNFMRAYSQRPEFKNTVFILTGDHPMTEIPITNNIKRYHVPLLIYSPSLKDAKIFRQTVSHLDVYESVLALLNSYQMQIPYESAALGRKLNVSEYARPCNIAFMNDNRDIVDFYSDGYYLSNDSLYKIDQKLNCNSIENVEMKKHLQKKLALFKTMNLYVSFKDKILPKE